MFKLIAGPCVVESQELCLQIAEHMQGVADKLGLDYYFKASFDKANRTSDKSFRGIGLDQGINTLQAVKAQVDCKILTDIHEPWQAPLAARVADVIQIPALLSRQTDLLKAAAKTGKTVNIKKGQFMSPTDAIIASTKISKIARETWITERGSTFGYNNLVVDMRSLEFMKGDIMPTIFDATHSVQFPGKSTYKSDGDRTMVEPLARAAVAVGVKGLFFETHPDPNNALSDGPNMVKLEDMEPMLERLMKIHKAAHD
jgi:2-dehydro-3-deoxyphosphooctonate aldolase (KDO 8-P synthase)